MNFSYTNFLSLTQYEMAILLVINGTWASRSCDYTPWALISFLQAIDKLLSIWKPIFREPVQEKRV